MDASSAHMRACGERSLILSIVAHLGLRSGSRIKKRRESGLGLVSRASPVHTALRNCTGDGGGPSGFGDQVADPKPP